MAPFTRKTLVCFYCQTTSPFKFDGKIWKFECATCEATNFLDENGDITDPPVAATHTVPLDIRYAERQSSPPSSQSSAFTFCSFCLKNQHLYNKSLAQYSDEFHGESSNNKNFAEDLLIFEDNLESRYPQVCEDCEEGAYAAIRSGVRKGRQDLIRKLRDSTENGTRPKRHIPLWIKVCDKVGGPLWWAGLAGQLIWDMTILLSSYRLFDNLEFNFPFLIDPNVIDAYDNIIAVFASNTWSCVSLLLSILTYWWSPLFNKIARNTDNWYIGHQRWFKVQFFLLIIRGSEILASNYDLSALLIRTMHVAVPVLALRLTRSTRLAIKVSPSPLFHLEPKRFKYVAPGAQKRSGSSQPGSGGLSDIMSNFSMDSRLRNRKPQQQSSNSQPFVDISSPSAPYRPPQQSSKSDTPSSPYRPSQKWSISPPNLNSDNTSSYEPRRPLPRLYDPNDMVEEILALRTTPSFIGWENPEVEHYLHSGQCPVWYKEHEDNKMDWEASTVHSNHNFNPRPQSNLNPRPQSMGSKQIVEDQQSFQSLRPSGANPFRIKVPPKPISPAQRILNPPRQPALNVSSPKTKENFFDNFMQQAHTSWKRNDNIKPEMLVQQQKFFYEQPNQGFGNELAGMLNSYHIHDDEALYNWKTFGASLGVVGVVGAAAGYAYYRQKE